MLCVARHLVIAGALLLFGHRSEEAVGFVISRVPWNALASLSMHGYCLRSMNVTTASLSLLLIAGLGAQVKLQSPPLDDARFAKLQALLTPAEDVTWRRIPWRIELLLAQREAAQQNKPLFVWAMDGHPLGCT